ncbi:hypothetical protein A4R43_29555 [Amycolatopsis albispora]|uniref:Uncharacterized protein n=1 Tax=Amycolatopsis albispora TaxID=1804986 RepID=A0A344LDI4_9PSEU|nr:hypothetical protein A4R43_29555 [Amycolatopsis albispora]
MVQSVPFPSHAVLVGLAVELQADFAPLEDIAVATAAQGAQPPLVEHGFEWQLSTARRSEVGQEFVRHDAAGGRE